MKVYIKKFIKSEADLPKEECWYFVQWKKGYYVTNNPETQLDKWYFNEDYSSLWMSWFNWYLEEREISNNLYSSDIGFVDGANFILNKLK